MKSPRFLKIFSPISCFFGSDLRFHTVRLKAERDTKMERSSRRSCAIRGFSLVEVLLALGVVTFGMIPVLGLLPVGMSTFRNSMNTTICSQIAQRVANELQQTDFDQILQNFSQASVRYFDAQGNELPVAAKSSAVYHVNLAFLNATTLPGSAGSNTNLGTVVVQIANNPGNKPLVAGATSLWTNQDVQIMTCSSKVARSQ